MNDEPQFIDAEQNQGGDFQKVTFRDIVLNHVRRIGTFASCEWRGGYWQEKLSPSGTHTIMRIYTPDSREVYSNAVDYLFDLLYPHFDKEMMKMAEEHERLLAETRDSIKQKAKAEGKDNEVFRQRFGSRKAELKRRLFREISCFLKRNRYLEGREFNDGAA